MKMLKYFALLIGCFFLIDSCDNSKNDDVKKMAITAKMQEKVRKVSAELKIYCDSEIYRKARWKADSILSERGFLKGLK